MVSTLKINSITNSNLQLKYSTTTADLTTTNSFSTDWFLNSTNDLDTIGLSFEPSSFSLSESTFIFNGEHTTNTTVPVTILKRDNSQPLPTELTLHDIYYVRAIDNLTLQLYDSFLHAQNGTGTPISISSLDVSNVKFCGPSSIHLRIKTNEWAGLIEESTALDISDYSTVDLISINVVNLGDGSDIFKIKKDTSEGEDIGIAYKKSSNSVGIKSLVSNELHLKISGTEGTGAGTLSDPFIIGSLPFFIIQGNGMESDPSFIRVHMKIKGFTVPAIVATPTNTNIPYPHMVNKPTNYVRNNFKFKPASQGATDSSSLLSVEKANHLFNGIKNGAYPNFPIDYSQFHAFRNAANWSK